MKVTIEGTKAELMELLSEIRRRDKEYITVPSPYYVYPTYTPYITKPYIKAGETTAHSAYGERREELAEQTEYKFPFHDEIMDALDKLTLRGDKE